MRKVLGRLAKGPVTLLYAARDERGTTALVSSHTTLHQH